MSAALPLVVVVPLAGAGLAVLAGRRLAPAIGLATALANVVTVATLVRDVTRHGPLRHLVGGWDAPLGIGLHADGLAAVMLAMTAAVAGAVTVYALAYFERPEPGAGWSASVGFWPLWLLLGAGLNALFLSADLFNLYVTLEVLTLAAVALIVLAGERVALTAGTRYLLAAFFGSLTYLLGVALVYAAHHTLDLRLIAGLAGADTVTRVALALMTLGLVLKTALFPLHFWLPQAHAAAPAPVSAALSALVVKASFYLVVRLWLETFPAVAVPAAAQFLGVLGVAAIVWGALQALVQARLKLLIAYSTVSQVGYFFLLVPLAVPPLAFEAWSGGIYLAVSHALAKASLFMAAGAVMHALGHDRIADLRGVAERLPVTALSIGAAGVTLAGLPPSGGFVGKWLFVRASVASGQWWWAVAVLAGGLLATVYVLLVLRQMLLRPDAPLRLREVPRTLEVTAFTLALAGLALGLRATEPLILLGVGGPFGAPGPGSP